MAEENIHTFIPSHHDDFNLTALTFVKEYAPSVSKQETGSFFSLCLIIQGEGILHTPQGAFPLYRGSLFLKIPNLSYQIENVFNLQYFYISYTGSQANVLMERIPYRESMPVWDGFDSLIPLWESTVKIKGAGIDLAAKGLIIYTFSFICSSFEESALSKSYTDYSQRMLHVKQYIDCHFTEAALCLKQVSSVFSYNYKYLSHEFKMTFGVGFTQYLNELRLDNAKRLIDRGIHSVKESAVQSGFTDTLYFSKLFRQYYGIPPREYIKTAASQSREAAEPSDSSGKECHRNEENSDLSDR